MALADCFDGFLIDFDGVVWLGREPVPGAAETLSRLLEEGKQLVFITNNPGEPAEAYARRLSEAGVPVDARRVLTAGTVTAQLAAAAVGEGGAALVIGAPAFKQAAKLAGLRVLDAEASAEADAVLVASHRDFDYGELLAATRAIGRGARLFATSRDPTMPMPDGPWPGTGAVLAAVETASGVRAEIGGKPERRLFDAACERIAAARRVAMIGDRISSDIAGAQRAGLDTILVLTGATSREEAERSATRPGHVIDDLAALLA